MSESSLFVCYNTHKCIYVTVNCGNQRMPKIFSHYRAMTEINGLVFPGLPEMNL